MNRDKNVVLVADDMQIIISSANILVYLYFFYFLSQGFNLIASLINVNSLIQEPGDM